MTQQEYEELATKLHGHIRGEKEEYILCAAIWYKDFPGYAGIQANYTAYNIDKGIVVTGHRHGQVIATMAMLTGLRTVQHGNDSVGETEQGFLTSKGRFVDRNEAGKIAFERGQITKETDCLFSEDLY